MKKICLLPIAFFAFSCNFQNEKMEGIWQVKNNFYSAIYSLSEDNNAYQALVLKYDDGTSKFIYDPNNPKYLFKRVYINEKKREVDVLSGATNKPPKKSNYSFQFEDDDTLRVTTFIAGKPLIEKWTRANL